jgi:hypothetical protein
MARRKFRISMVLLSPSKPKGEPVPLFKIGLPISERRFVSSLLGFLAGTAAIAYTTVKRAPPHVNLAQALSSNVSQPCVWISQLGDVVQLVKNAAISPPSLVFQITYLADAAGSELRLAVVLPLGGRIEVHPDF